METWVLIPQELSLALIPSDRDRDRLKPSVTVFSNVRVSQGTFFYPFQGTIRLDKFEMTSYLDEKDVSAYLPFIFVFSIGALPFQPFAFPFLFEVGYYPRACAFSTQKL